MQRDKPLISIITIVKNAENSIDRCIQSVINSKNDLPVHTLEYIVIDGNSKDGTKEIIDKYILKGIDKFESADDNGISDAFNKGITRANGNWILFVNSDDWIVRKSLSHAKYHLENSLEKVTFLTGGVYLWENDIMITESYSRIENISRESCIHHAATFIRKKNILKETWFKTNYKLAMDYEFFLRLIVFKGHSIHLIPVIITNRSLAGISYSNNSLALKETKTIRSTYFSNSNTIIWYLFAVCKNYIGRLLKNNVFLNPAYRLFWIIWNKNSQ